MLEINLSVLTSFNPALIYAFEPETDLRIDMDAQRVDHYQYLKSYVSQQTDMYEGLIYAQDEILPILKNGLESIDAQQLIHWIKNIHGKVAKTVLSFQDEPAGTYATATVFRWEQFAVIQAPILKFLSNLMPCSLNDFCQIMARDFSVDPSSFKQFMAILIRLQADDSIHVNQAYYAKSNEPRVKSGAKTLSKLQQAYHGNINILTPDEKKIVNQFVKICILPDQVEAAMIDYAERAVMSLKSSDMKNKSTAASVLAEIFYGLVEIHPFVNGNGRTATALINSLLVAIGQPSILLRCPGDRDNRNSLYFQAFEVINTTREPLSSLILHRLNSGVYHDEVACQAAVLKSQVLLVAEEIESKFGATMATNTMYDMVTEFTRCVEERGLMSILTQKQIEKAFAIYALDGLVKLKHNLQTKQVEHAQSTFELKKRFVSTHLTRITGYEWKIFKDKNIQKSSLAENAVAYMELSNDEEGIAMQTKLGAALKEMGCMTVTITKRADNKIPVLKLDGFNFIKLLESNSLPVMMEPKLNQEVSSMKY